MAIVRNTEAVGILINRISDNVFNNRHYITSVDLLLI